MEAASKRNGTFSQSQTSQYLIGVGVRESRPLLNKRSKHLLQGSSCYPQRCRAAATSYTAHGGILSARSSYTDVQQEDSAGARQRKKTEHRHEQQQVSTPLLHLNTSLLTSSSSTHRALHMTTLN